MSTKKSARTVAGASAVDIVLSLADDGQGKTQNPLKTSSVATLLSGANYNVFGLFEPCAGYCAFTPLPAGWRCMNAQEVIV